MKIIEITGIESWNKNGKVHHRTHAILEDGSVVQGYGIDYKVGQQVESFWDEDWDTYKMQPKRGRGAGPTQTNLPKEETK